MIDPVERSGRAAERFLLWSGAAFAVTQLGTLVYFGGAVASKWPALGAPVGDRVAFFVENWDRVAFANMLLPLPTPFFLLFLGGLFAVLRRAEGSGGALSVTALAAGIASAMVWPIGMVIGSLAMDIGRQGGDPVTMQVLEGIAPLTLALSAMPRAVMVGAASVVVLGTGCAPRWVGWAGLALAGITLAGTATLHVPSAFALLAVGMLLYLLWIAVLSIALDLGVRGGGGSGLSSVRPRDGTSPGSDAFRCRT